MVIRGPVILGESMANQYFNQFHYSPIPMLTSIFAKVTIGASGAPTLVTTGGLSKAVASISRNGAGDYTLTLTDTYPYFVGIRCVFNGGATGPAAPVVSVRSETVSTTKTVRFLCQNGGINTDPASGEVMFLEFVLKNSSSF